MKARINSGSLLPFGPRIGFTLIEILVVLFVLGVSMLVGTAVLVGAFQANKVAAGDQDRLTTHGTLADQFRADVSQAEAAPDSVGQFKAGPTCLILRRPDHHHVVYQYQDRKLERSEVAGTGTFKQLEPLLPQTVAVDFLRDGPDGRLLTLRVEEASKPGGGQRRIEFAAALGGNLR